jgi:hypothetical protein
MDTQSHTEKLYTEWQDLLRLGRPSFNFHTLSFGLVL